MEVELEEISDPGDRETMHVQATHSLKLSERMIVPSKAGRISFDHEIIPEKEIPEDEEE
jgi:hypothetical protein